jgi:hypothetical protein
LPAQAVEGAIDEIEPVLSPEQLALDDEGRRPEDAEPFGLVAVVAILPLDRRTPGSAMSRSSAQSARSSACDSRKGSSPAWRAAITMWPAGLFQPGTGFSIG